MKIAVLADGDGEIIALAHCRMSPTGLGGTFTEDANIRAEVRRSALDAHRGRRRFADPAAADDVVTSVTLNSPRNSIT